ncbi:hypothetical protein [Novisyntrophococcus fermenticellae]|uniref:hypothetical protein n=1 Tax=Novisyntrophococcus fermenticellae TaxID=2068655 RepID=UPI001E651E70|nr:hypothetical protein [Novisyntrophococcus fermenticellae]
MFRMWGKLIKNNKMMEDQTICNDTSDSRTDKVFDSLNEICDNWDLSKPIWLDKNIAEFKKHAKTRFDQDHFIDHIDFDYLEIQVIEEG